MNQRALFHSSRRPGAPCGRPIRPVFPKTFLLSGLTWVAACLLTVHAQVLGPYLSALDTADPLVVLHTAETQTVRMAYRSLDGSLARSFSMGKSHHLPLPSAALERISDYTIQVGNEDPVVYPFHYAAPAADAVSFVVVGDAQNRQSPERRRAVMRALEAHRPSFIVHTGDLHAGKGGPGGHDDPFGEDWRINFFDPMPPLQTYTPFYPVFGNHDDEQDGQREAFRRVFPYWPENGSYHFQAGPAAFFFLDIQNQIREFFGKGQDVWLREAVAHYPDVAWRVAVFHVSPWSGGHRGEREWTVGGREPMLAVLQALAIDVVFCGHDHNYQRMRPVTRVDARAAPVQFVVVGVAGANFYDAEKKPYTSRVVNRQDHYAHVQITPDTFAVRALTPQGEELDHFTLHRSPDRVDPPVAPFEVHP